MQNPSTICDGMLKSRFILLHPEDNVLVCCRPADTGEIITVGKESIVLMQAVELGHKVARRALHKGAKIMKYGASIGSAVQAIRPGEHVHLHNMKSDYIRPHTRERLQEIGDDNRSTS